ncbi:MAG: hypothetical protein R3C30_08225 [Hyphomonadaceae bacterium]
MTDTALPVMPAPASTTSSLAAGVRISEIDMLRGLVIILKARRRDWWLSYL